MTLQPRDGRPSRERERLHRRVRQVVLALDPGLIRPILAFGAGLPLVLLSVAPAGGAEVGVARRAPGPYDARVTRPPSHRATA